MGGISDELAKAVDRAAKLLPPKGYIPPSHDPHILLLSEMLSYAEDRIKHLEKLVHILWKEAERLQGRIKFTNEGIALKDGAAEILVLKNGGVVIHGNRVAIETPGKSQLFV
jgi:hypothetical protein